jgi:hypothetical protein
VVLDANTEAGWSAGCTRVVESSADKDTRTAPPDLLRLGRRGTEGDGSGSWAVPGAAISGQSCCYKHTHIRTHTGLPQGQPSMLQPSGLPASQCSLAPLRAASPCYTQLWWERNASSALGNKFLRSHINQRVIGRATTGGRLRNKRP